MYIGDVHDGTGLHHMVFEVVDNSIDEALAGYADQVDVRSCRTARWRCRTMAAASRWISTRKRAFAAEVILTVLHAGGKFDDNSYKVSGGLHGVGVSVVNALSEHLWLDIWRDGYHSAGIPAGRAGLSAQAAGAFGQARHHAALPPAVEIFSDVESTTTSARRLRELSFLNSGVKIALIDERGKGTATITTTKAASAASSSIWPSEDAAASGRDLGQRRAMASSWTWRCSGPTPTRKRCTASPTTSRRRTAARIWPVSAPR
jgi:DNA gyrase subunit B